MGQPGVSGLRRLSNIIAEPSAIKWAEHLSEWLIVERHRGSDEETSPLKFDVGDWRIFPSARDALLAMGVIDRGENNEATIDPALTSAVKDVVAELEN